MIFPKENLRPPRAIYNALVKNLRRMVKKKSALCFIIDLLSAYRNLKNFECQHGTMRKSSDLGQ